MPFKKKNSRTIKGFTLVEIIVALTIIGFMVSISLVSFSNFLRRENLYANSSALASALREARSRTLASIKGMQYGVKIDTDRFTVFSGSTFSSSTADNSYIFSNGVQAKTLIPILIFSRVTGNSSASGTIDLYLSSSPTTKKSVNVQGTGLVNLF
jgi:prepilin-type N-terminal cleavage/methylation domain-containing protein